MSRRRVRQIAERWAQERLSLDSSGHSLSDAIRCKVLGRLIESDETSLVSDPQQLLHAGESMAEFARSGGLTHSSLWVEIIALNVTLTHLCAKGEKGSLLSTQANRNAASTFLKHLSSGAARTLQGHNYNSVESMRSNDEQDAGVADQSVNTPDDEVPLPGTERRKWLHDLRSPLQAALLTTEMALMDDPIETSSSDMRQELEDIRSSIKRSIDLMGSFE